MKILHSQHLQVPEKEAFDKSGGDCPGRWGQDGSEFEGVFPLFLHNMFIHFPSKLCSRSTGVCRSRYKHQPSMSM